MKPIKIELNQEDVDRMVKGLSDQKWVPCYVYHDEKNGRRCAVGHMVSEEDARALHEDSMSVCDFIELDFLVVVDHDDRLLLQELQDENDLDENVRDGRTPEQRATSLRRRILHWCLRHGYEFNDPNVEVSR